MRKRTDGPSCKGAKSLQRPPGEQEHRLRGELTARGVRLQPGNQAVLVRTVRGSQSMARPLCAPTDEQFLGSYHMLGPVLCLGM